MFLEVDYDIDIAQVCRFMGYPQTSLVPGDIFERIKRAVIQSEKPQAYAVVNEVALGSPDLPWPKQADRLSEELKECQTLVFAVVSLGEGFYPDKYPATGTNDFDSLLKDALGTAGLNSAAAIMEEQLREIYRKNGLELTARLSPGENDISFDWNRTIFSMPGIDMLDVLLTEQLMIEPLKTYAMFYGVYKDDPDISTPVPQKTKCDICIAEACQFREVQFLYRVHVRAEIEKTLYAEKGQNLWSLLTANGFFTGGDCAGKHICGKCRVRVRTEQPILFQEEERALLDAKNAAEGERLACFVSVDQDMFVDIPYEEENQQILKEYITLSSDTIDEQKGYGIAVDLGTTTVVAYLVDLEKGLTVDTHSFLNPQRVYGADVISRMEYSLKHPEGKKILRQVITAGLDSAVTSLCQKNRLQRDKINKMTIAGNTIMRHMLTGRSCGLLARAPYGPAETELSEISAESLGLRIAPRGEVILLPGISAFLGSDILAGVCLYGLYDAIQPELLIDLGTNGEMVLGSEGKLVACSTAAGPAFEGGRILHGIGGIAGAIEHVDFSKEKIYTTIKQLEPIGICGSGILDLVAELLKSRIIDKSGRMQKAGESQGLATAELQERITVTDDQTAFLIDKQAGIIFTQKDVREFQLAKAAVSAGVSTLLAHLELNVQNINTLYLAGGLGSNMNVGNAALVGLIPQELTQKTIAAGNTSGAGAIRALLSKEFCRQMTITAKKIEYIDLALRDDFGQQFIRELDFPENG